MSNYIIGDIQGCYREFIDLLDLIGFDTKNDKLWLTGDMINRGPDSLAVINFLMKHQDSVILRHCKLLLVISQSLIMW